MRSPFPMLACVTLSLLPAALAGAQTSSPNAGALLAIHPGPLRAPLLVVPQPDTGALAVLLDARSGLADVYVQRVDRHGRPLLAEGGVLAWTLGTGDYLDDSMADGSGGALLVMSVQRGATGRDIVVKRILGDGSQPYGPDGLVVCSATRDQVRPRLAPGPAGSYYVGWVDDRANAGYYQDLYVQRVSLAGAPQWAANGVLVNSATYRASSGNGIVGWTSDLQGGVAFLWWTSSGNTTRAQRLNSAGALLWTANGVAVGQASDALSELAPDGSGGVWGTSSRWNGTYSSYQAHHVLGTGVVATLAAGIEYHSPIYQGSLSTKLVRNASGGCFIFAMRSYYSSTGSGAFIRQEISSAGTVLRGTDGEYLTSIPDMPAVLESNGSILVGLHEALLATPQARLRLQRYALDGTAQFPGTGFLVGRQNLLQYVLSTALALGSDGNLYAGWADSRYWTPDLPANYQAFGQVVTPAGEPLWDDAELPILRGAGDAANDQGGYVRVTWDASKADHPAAAVATGYRVWRALPAEAAAGLARVRPEGDGMFRVGERTLLSQAGVFWELAGEQPAATLPQYAMTVPTMQDSVAGNPATQSFMVEAYDDSSHHWFSGSLDARSVDNLGPGAITSAVGFYDDGSTSLYWSGVADLDLCCYDVFRGSSPGFVPSESNRVTTTSQLASVDPHGAPAYYRIAARDVHGNLGPSALVIPQGTLATDDEAPREWRLKSAWSAERGALELSLDVPRDDEGQVELFDVTGRRLWSRAYRAQGSGSLAFLVAPEAGLRPGLVYARAVSATGRQLVARAIVLR